MKIWNAFWYLALLSYRQFLTKMSYILVPTIVLITAVALFPSNPALRENGIMAQLTILLFFTFGLYGLVLICILPSLLMCISHVSMEKAYLTKQNVTELPFQKADIKAAFLAHESLSSREWFLVSSGLRIHIYHVQYIRKISGTKETQLSRSRSDYGVKILTKTGASPWIYFSSAREQRAFLYWHRVSRNL